MRMFLKTTFLLGFFFLVNFSFSQSERETRQRARKISPYFCGTDILLKDRFLKDTSFQNNHKRLEERLYQKKIQGKNLKKISGGYAIPVVVHVIHNNGTENISDLQILQGIRDLNDAFKKISPYDGNASVDVEIQFCLAVQDEGGNYTTGINRIQSPLTNMTMETEDLSLKDLSRWNPSKYVNIWLVNEINSLSVGTGVAAYAYLASVHGAPEDGIVCEAFWFGSSKDNSKTMIHEMGHYLNLYHTFEEGCINNNCLMDGDKVCDTPPDNIDISFFCGMDNSCNSDEDDISVNNPFRSLSLGGLGDQLDMDHNYMDYSPLSCQNAFTEGQKERMTSALSGPRASLLNSMGCESLCSNPVSASFTYNPVGI
ncbi:MAG: hypothetical protein K2X86_14620, partial [Cytophagaceae bacterium]|nr:hypothetical protein [Cytophagaceae bacterium]